MGAASFRVPVQRVRHLQEEEQEGEIEKSSEDKADAEKDKAEVTMAEYLGGK